jgi:hypothetical protein
MSAVLLRITSTAGQMAAARPKQNAIIGGAHREYRVNLGITIPDTAK